MSEKLEQMRTHLHTKLDAVVDQLEAAKANLETAPKEAKADVLAKLEAAKTKLEAKKHEVDAAKAHIKEFVEAKKGDIEEQIEQWKANREHDKLVKRAERAENYAETCIVVALAAAVEADQAVLQAAAARMDAE